jgi:hypothetical protein
MKGTAELGALRTERIGAIQIEAYIAIGLARENEMTQIQRGLRYLNDALLHVPQVYPVVISQGCT